MKTASRVLVGGLNIKSMKEVVLVGYSIQETKLSLIFMENMKNLNYTKVRKGETDMKLYFYFLEDNGIRTAECEAEEKPKTYKIIGKSPTGFYKSTVNKDEIGVM